MRARVLIAGGGLALALLLAGAGCAKSPPTPTPTATPVPPALATATPTPPPAMTSAASPVGDVLAVMNVMGAAGFHAMETDLKSALVLKTQAPVQGVYVGLDSIGSLAVHDLEKTLEGATDMSAVATGPANNIKNTLAVLGAAPWPDVLKTDVAKSRESLETLRTALVAGDRQKAMAAAEAAHEATHDLSLSAYEWLAEQAGVKGSGGPAAVAAYLGSDTISKLALHDLEKTLEGAKDMTSLGTGPANNIKNALALLGALAWPEDLQAEVAAARKDLGALRDALVAADLMKAMAAAETAHESTHDLSVSAYEWLAGQSGGEGTGPLAVLSTYAGLDTISGLALHDLEKTLEGAKDMSSLGTGPANNIKNALALFGALAWPEDLHAEMGAAETDLAALRDALLAADREKAMAAAEAAHESTHDLSVSAYEWLGEQDGAELMGQLVNQRYTGTAKNVGKALKAAKWEGELGPLAQTLQADLLALEKPLIAGDLEAAAEAAERVDGAEHNLSMAMYEWMAEAGKGMGASAHMAMADPGTVMAGLVAVDAASFHDLEEALEAAKSAADIPTGEKRNVSNLALVAAAVGWPDDLSKESTALRDAVASLDAALTSGDLAAAKQRAEAVHEAQHDFSMAAYDWLGTQKGKATGAAAMLTSAYLADRAQFHEMTEAHSDMAGHTANQSADLRTTKRVLTAAQAVAWPADMGTEAQAFMRDLGGHAAAMEGTDLAKCQALGEAVHESEHDWSMALYAGLGS